MSDTRPTELAQYVNQPQEWLQSHGAYRAHLASAHAEAGRHDMAAEYLAESAAWFELARAAGDEDGDET